MKHIYSLLVLLFTVNLCVSAQSIIITGKITGGTDNSPLTGVSVSATGNETTVQAPTDAMGIYTIKVPPDAKNHYFKVGSRPVILLTPMNLSSSALTNID